jgi:histidine triad (HIT) family protein
VAREIPANIVYQDDCVTAFRDINPEAPVHILIIPNSHIGSLDELTRDDELALGKVMRVAGQIALQEGIATKGYRIVANLGGDAGQVVSHLHAHLLGGRKMLWPPG